MKAMTIRLSVILLAGFMFLPPRSWAQPEVSPLEKYRKQEFPNGWKDRVALEFEIINSASLEQLRSALKDSQTHLRTLAVRVLGIRGDRESAKKILELAQSDPQSGVRYRAIEALGLLKMKPEVIRGLARKDDFSPVLVKFAAGQAEEETDYAELIRKAYAVGIKQEAMASAKVGQRAPDLTLQTSAGKEFRLSEVLGKKAVLLYFAAEYT